jgi:hypothetical protein
MANQYCRKPLQDIVAAQVPNRVVNRLEPIHIENRQSEWLTEPLICSCHQ